MKKKLCIIVVLMITLGFVACGNESGSAAGEGPSNAGRQEESEEEASQPETPSVEPEKQAEVSSGNSTDQAEAASVNPEEQAEASLGNSTEQPETASVEPEELAEASSGSSTEQAAAAPVSDQSDSGDRLLYMGHASLRITTAEGKVIYIDPYAGEGYEPAADLILITHEHYDHNAPEKVANRAPDCEILTWKEALADGEYQSFDYGYVAVEAVEAGNTNHDVKKCAGYILTLSDGISVYVSGDTSMTQLAEEGVLESKEIDYAFICCDGIYNMDLEEASAFASLVHAKHTIPYHVTSAEGGLFDRERAEQFQAENLLILEPGEEIILAK